MATALPCASGSPPALEPLAIAPLAPSASVAAAAKREPALLEDEKRDDALPVAFPLETIDRYGFLLSDKYGKPNCCGVRDAFLMRTGRKTQAL